jgi:hypothetical protein
MCGSVYIILVYCGECWVWFGGCMHQVKGLPNLQLKPPIYIYIYIYI